MEINEALKLIALKLIGVHFLAPQFTDRTIYKEAEDAYGDDDRYVPINTLDDEYVIVKKEEYDTILQFLNSLL